MWDSNQGTENIATAVSEVPPMTFRSQYFDLNKSFDTMDPISIPCIQTICNV